MLVSTAITAAALVDLIDNVLPFQVLKVGIDFIASEGTVPELEWPFRFAPLL
jgi:hypothetical protein